MNMNMNLVLKILLEKLKVKRVDLPYIMRIWMVVMRKLNLLMKKLNLWM